MIGITTYYCKLARVRIITIIVINFIIITDNCQCYFVASYEIAIGNINGNKAIQSCAVVISCGIDKQPLSICVVVNGIKTDMEPVISKSSSLYGS